MAVPDGPVVPMPKNVVKLAVLSVVTFAVVAYTLVVDIEFEIVPNPFMASVFWSETTNEKMLAVAALSVPDALRLGAWNLDETLIVPATFRVVPGSATVPIPIDPCTKFTFIEIVFANCTRTFVTEIESEIVIFPGVIIPDELAEVPIPIGSDRVVT